MENTQHTLSFPKKEIEEAKKAGDNTLQLLEICGQAHKAIHSTQQTVTLAGQLYPIIAASNGCRSVSWRDITFMEQNKAKTSRYAQWAREGKRITWGIRFGNWIYIDDEQIGVWRNGQLDGKL